MAYYDYSHQKRKKKPKAMTLQKKWYHKRESYRNAIVYSFISFFFYGVLFLIWNAVFDVPYWVFIVCAIAPLIVIAQISGLLFLLLYLTKSKEALRLQELKQAGVKYNCLSCEASLEPLHYRCPSCDTPHKAALFPNEYGIYNHNCIECDHKLSTRLSHRQEQNMQLCCPHCEGEVPNIVGIDKHFVIAGHQESKQSNFFLEVSNTLVSKHRAKLVVLDNEIQSTPLLRLESGENTLALPTRIQLICPTKESKHPHQLHLYDMTTNQKNATKSLFYKNTDCLFFLLNPYSVPNFRAKQGQSKKSKKADRQPLRLIRDVVQNLEKYKNNNEIKKIKFVLVLTKTETGYLDSILSDATNSVLQNFALEDFIQKELEAGAFVHYVRQHFDSVDFHALPSLSNLAEITTENAIKKKQLDSLMETVCIDMGIRL